MSLLSDLQLGKGFSGGKDTITKILSPFKNLSGTVGDIGRSAEALKMLPNQIRTKSDMVQVKNTLRSLNQVLKNSKISNFLNKLENAVQNSIVGAFNPYIDTRTRQKVEYDKDKVVQIVQGIRAKRDARVASEIERMLISGAGFDQVVKILDGVKSNNPNWGVDNILSLLPENLMKQFAPKFLNAFKSADNFLGISNGIQNLISGKTWGGNPKPPKITPTADINRVSSSSASGVEEYKNLIEQTGGDPSKVGSAFDRPIPVDALAADVVEETDEKGNKVQVAKFQNPYTGLEDTYQTTPENKEFLKKVIADINPAPFDGYFRSRLGRLELASTHLWDIQIIPMKTTKGEASGVPVLEMEDIDLLPITNWSLDAGQTLSDSMEMFGGSSITIPTTKKIDMRFEATFVEDSSYSVKTWLSKYKKFMFHNNRVRPYKECCSIIGIWLLDLDLKELYYQAYLGYPIDLTEGLEGESSHSPINKTVTFAIVGQLSSEEFYQQIQKKKKGRHWDRAKLNTVYKANFDRSKVKGILENSKQSEAYEKLFRKVTRDADGNPQTEDKVPVKPKPPATKSKSTGKVSGKKIETKAKTKSKTSSKKKK